MQNGLEYDHQTAKLQQLGLQQFYRHWSLKSLNRHLNFWKCSPTVEYIAVLWDLIFCGGGGMTETTWRAGIDRRKMHGFEFGHLRGDNLGLNIVLSSFVMQRWILIKIIPLFYYMLNLWLLMQNPIIAHIALEQGPWCWLLTSAWYIALSLISQYHSLDPNNRDISRVRCIESIVQGCGISSAPAMSGDTTVLHWAIETATLVAMPYIHSILQDWYLQCISNGDTTFLH